MLNFDDETHRIVAVLHDVVEDTHVTLDVLQKSGFSDLIVDAVNALTRRADETYSNYIIRCSENAIARRVKIVDIMDNLRPNPSVRIEEWKSLQKRHGKALRILWDAGEKGA